MPAPTLVGATIEGSDVSIGAGAETGILVGDIDYSVDNPFVEFYNVYGGIIGKAVGHNPTLTLNINGEVEDKDAGLNVITYIVTTSPTVANEDFFASATSTHHGIDFSSAQLHLTEASGSQPRGGARTVSFTFVKHENLADA